jgi:CRISPR/Cas system CMR-associated protein Cmr3 (group 5 of RAMP superfamily)
MGGVTGPSRSWLAFRPRDTVFVRDGRAFDASQQSAAQAVRPWPSTIAGAVRAAYGTEPAEVVGPVVARSEGSRWTPYLAVPRDLVATVEEVPYVVRLIPETFDVVTDLPDAQDPKDLRYPQDPKDLKDPKTGPTADGTAPAGPTRLLVPSEDGIAVEPVEGLLSGEVVTQYLSGGFPDPGGVRRDEVEVADPIVLENRVGLAREDRKARQGYLYQAGHLRMDDGWCFLAGCTPDGGQVLAPSGPVPLGGRTRLADVEDAGQVCWPDRPDTFPGGRVLLYVATPAIWPDGWRPPLPPGVELVAAATGEPVTVATTSPRLGWRENRALRWAVPAGSVYLLRFSGGSEGVGGNESDSGSEAALRWCEKVHATAYGRDEKDRLRTAGFGVVLTGVWS